MSKSLYEEALADAKQLKEVAENNAKRAIIDAVTPRIKSLIEQQLLGESNVVSEGDDDIDLLSDLATNDDEQASAISTPDEEGKVTLDLDALKVGGEPSEVEQTQESNDTPDVSSDSNVEDSGVDETEYELTSESVSSLIPLLGKTLSDDKAELDVYKLGENVRRLLNSGNLIKGSLTFPQKIDEAIQQIENMYSHVYENVSDESKRSMLENKLEGYYKDTKGFKESNMTKQRNTKSVNEEAVVLKISGIPDEVDIEDLDVDLMSDDSDDDSQDAGDMSDDGSMSDDDMSGEGSDEGADDDMANEADMFELAELDENTVVEIDESMLRREIARLTEKKAGRKDVLSDFGGGESQGDAFADGGEDITESQEGDISDTELAELEEEVNESIASQKKDLKEGRKPSKKEGINESVVSNTADKAELANLRKQLNQVNLFNAKLVYANKLLQKEGITSKQKAVIIEQLDETKSVREAKLVYESLCRTLLGSSTKRSVNESTQRKVMGSSSRASNAGSTVTLNESSDVQRWSVLAGIGK